MQNAGSKFVSAMSEDGVTRGSGFYFEYSPPLSVHQRYLYDSKIGRTNPSFYRSSTDSPEAMELYPVFTMMTGQDILDARAKNAAKYAYRIDRVQESLLDAIPLVFPEQKAQDMTKEEPAPPSAPPPSPKRDVMISVAGDAGAGIAPEALTSLGSREFLKNRISTRLSLSEAVSSQFQAQTLVHEGNTGQPRVGDGPSSRLTNALFEGLGYGIFLV